MWQVSTTRATGDAFPTKNRHMLSNVSIVHARNAASRTYSLGSSTLTPSTLITISRKASRRHPILSVSTFSTPKCDCGNLLGAFSKRLQSLNHEILMRHFNKGKPHVETMHTWDTGRPKPPGLPSSWADEL